MFIAEPQVARDMARQMPAGRAHCVLENDGMPALFKTIFSTALVQARL